MRRFPQAARRGLLTASVSLMGCIARAAIAAPGGLLARGIEAHLEVGASAAAGVSRQPTRQSRASLSEWPLCPLPGPAP